MLLSLAHCFSRPSFPQLAARLHTGGVFCGRHDNRILCVDAACAVTTCCSPDAKDKGKGKGKGKGKDKEEDGVDMEERKRAADAAAKRDATDLISSVRLPCGH